MFRHAEFAFREKNTAKKYIKCIDKSIPLQVWRDPKGSRRFWLPDFKTIST